MSAPGSKEAIDIISACALTDGEKAAAIAYVIRDLNVAQGIVNTPAALRVATIKQLIAPSFAPSPSGIYASALCVPFD